MAVVISAIMEGLGLAISFYFNGSTGGTDIVAACINKFKDISLGQVLMVCDILIVSSSYLIFHDVQKVIFGYVLLILAALALDFFTRRFHQAVEFKIFSRNYSAIAERGLMVLDVIAHGKSGHAARNEGVNAIYEALDDMQWIRDYRFEKTSPLLGPVKMTLTVVNAGTQHNVVPDLCTMLVDVRTNECYTNEEVFDIIQSHLKSEVKAHSFRLHSSHIAPDHPLVKRCVALGLTPFGSPTLSDQALMPWPSLKLGPGESSRSHTADEFICLSEMERAIAVYQRLLGGASW